MNAVASDRQGGEFLNCSMNIVHVHAFTFHGRGGSPTAVVLGAEGLSADEMWAIAQAEEASHTAFVVEPATPQDHVSVRFFTASGEIKNCGHGSIAAHYARAMAGAAREKSFYQHTQEGLQRIGIHPSADGWEVDLQLNEVQFREVSLATISALIHALGISRGQLEVADPVVLASPGAWRFLLAVKTVEDLDAITPDFALLKEVNAAHASMGCFVYVLDEETRRVDARMFAPNIGVDEDIINGNASGCLAAWLLHLSGEDEIRLDVFQGKRFGMEGLVRARAIIHEDHVITTVGGFATVI
jgi:trans-2,3-dihydro-3-hydroxyanthranilate isomerase